MVSATLRYFVFFLFHGSLLLADPYQILGVSPDASDEEIKKAYLKKARVEHPDVSSLPKTEAESRFKEIQAAWEQIQKKQGRSVEKNQERKQARDEATRILEKAWNAGSFSPETFQELPRFKQFNSRSPLSPFPTRTSKEDGEWEAIEDFFRKHQDDFLQRNPNEESLLKLLRNLDSYASMTANSVKSVRSGFTDPLEQAIFERTENRALFLDALKERLERLNRSGAFLQTTSPSEERKRAFGKLPELFARRFGVQDGSSPDMKLAHALLDHAFSTVGSNRVQIHELGYLIRSVPHGLSPKDKLTYLAKFLERLGENSKDLKERAERAIQQVFSKHPDLAKEYESKTGFWKRWTGSLPTCDILLGKLARQSL